MYGTSTTSVIAKKTETPGKAKYLIRRLFMPYKKLCFLYPKLKKIPLLYPYYTIVRWFSVLHIDIFKRIKNEVKLNHGIEQNQINKIRDLFDKLGL